MAAQSKKSQILNMYNWNQHVRTYRTIQVPSSFWEQRIRSNAVAVSAIVNRLKRYDLAGRFINHSSGQVKNRARISDAWWNYHVR